MELNRREFLRSLALFGTSALLLRTVPSWAGALTSGATEPHFFLELWVRGGWDTQYLFDARPLSMRAAGLRHDYLGLEPLLWEGSNGQKAWLSPQAKNLLSLRSDLTLVNGFMVTDGPDGHDQATNIWFTGNFVGGESFLPYLNATPQGGHELDALMRGSLPPTMTNGDRILALTPSSAESLTKRFQNQPAMESANSTYAYLAERYRLIGEGAGSLSDGARKMGNALRDAPALGKKISQITLPPREDFSTQFGELSYMTKLSMEYFRKGLTRSALLMTSDSKDFFLDTHSPETAKKHPQSCANIAKVIEQVITMLKKTEYSPGRSFLDVTTVVISSEFSRTLRQSHRPIDDTGTDHNGLSNSLLLAGKGIRSGLVVGASDFADEKEVLSKAHLKRDPAKVHLMARPFDFTSESPRLDKPEDYQAKHYLQAGSIVNTLLGLYGVPDRHYRKLERNGVNCPVLKSLLA